MDPSFSPKDEIWSLRVCHHISNAVYNISFLLLKVKLCKMIFLMGPTSYPEKSVPK